MFVEVFRKNILHISKLDFMGHLFGGGGSGNVDNIWKYLINIDQLNTGIFCVRRASWVAGIKLPQPQILTILACIFFQSFDMISTGQSCTCTVLNFGGLIVGSGKAYDRHHDINNSHFSNIRIMIWQSMS